VNDIQYAGWAPHLRIGGFSVLLPLVLGLAILVPWVWLGGFGIFLGLIGDVAWLFWWRQKRGGVFPPDVSAGTLAKMVVAVVVLGGLAFLAQA